MLSKAVFIWSPASIGGGKYTAQIFFSDGAVAKYVAYGDYIQDKIGREYEVITPTVLPVTDGATVTMQYVTADALPTQDSNFDSLVYTPGQVDVEPEVRVAGSIISSTIYTASDYEYTVEANWDVPAVANKAVVGDSIVDANGKEFTISFLSGSLFGAPFRVIEVEKTIAPPTIGIATLYRPSTDFNLFRGTKLTDASRTRIRARDQYHIDKEITESASDTFKKIKHILTAGDMTAKKITLPHTPLEPTEVMVRPEGGIPQVYEDDYIVTGDELSWDGRGLDGLVEEGEELYVKYFARD